MKLLADKAGPNDSVESSTWFALVGLLVVMLIGFTLRLDSLSIWLDNPDRFFLGTLRTPLILTVDGYYYLDIAREIQAGGYEPFDPRRQVPGGYLRTAVPPLMSVLLALLSSLTSAPLEWVAILLPPFLGALLAIPIFMLARELGLILRSRWIDERRRNPAATVMGLVSALFALLSPSLASRTATGFFDTDSLNVVFPVLAAYLALRYADEENSKRRHYWFAAWVITLLIFLWWWDQSILPVFALAGLPMLVAMLLVGLRSPRDLVPPLAALGLIALVGFAWKGLEIFDLTRYLQQVSGILAYITDEVGDSPFPASGKQVSEQNPVMLATIALESAGGWAAFALAIASLLGLMITARYHTLYLVAILAVSALSSNSHRFLIFTAPLFGLGIGFVSFLVWNRLRSPGWRAATLPCLLIAAGWGAVIQALDYDMMVPRRTPALYNAMVELEKSTPTDSVIWSNWGNGHPLVYYANRGTMGDGIFHPSSLLYALDFPLTSTDYRLAANWMSFVVAHGLSGLQKANALLGDGPDDWASGIPRLHRLLAAGPQDGRQLLRRETSFDDTESERHLAFLFPGSTRPTYLLLSLIRLEDAWYRIGRWDFQRRATPEDLWFVPLMDLAPVRGTTLRGNSVYGRMTVDWDSGRLELGDLSTGLKRISVHDGIRLETREFSDHYKLVMNVVSPARLGVIMDEVTAESVFAGLFFKVKFDARYFTPVMAELPDYSVWKVEGDRYRPSTGHPTRRPEGPRSSSSP